MRSVLFGLIVLVSSSVQAQTLQQQAAAKGTEAVNTLGDVTPMKNAAITDYTALPSYTLVVSAIMTDPNSSEQRIAQCVALRTQLSDTKLSAEQLIIAGNTYRLNAGNYYVLGLQAYGAGMYDQALFRYTCAIVECGNAAWCYSLAKVACKYYMSKYNELLLL